MDKLSFKTPESPKDSRNVLHQKLDMGGPLVKGGIIYTNHDNQAHEGICTAISDTQLNGQGNSKKYNADFFYLCEKIKDGNWTEGSSILTSLKVANQIGFLPAELWTHTTQADRELPYEQYIAKLQAIPQLEIQRLILLCVDKIPGYASVDVSDPQAIAQAIAASKAGILCRYSVDANWYTAPDGRISWLTADINPMRPPAANSTTLGGHAITASAFDFTSFMDIIHANTWGDVWNKQGNCDINWTNYKPTEAWVILNQTPVIPPFQFLHDLQLGMTSPDVKQLQILLNKNPATQVATIGAGSPGQETSFFGALTYNAVKRFQKLYNVSSTGFVGTLTRMQLNLLINK